MEDVVKAASSGVGGVAEAFEGANDILGRYETLRVTNADLHAQAESSAAELESLRSETAFFSKQSRDRMLVTSSTTQQVRSELENVRATVSDLTSVREFAETDVRNAKTVAGRTGASIRNLYTRVCMTAPPGSFVVALPPEVRPDAPNYLTEVLRTIGDRIEDLDAIVSEYPAWKVWSACARTRTRTCTTVCVCACAHTCCLHTRRVH
ncbi:hypothetical protein EON67_05305, partial [archaeon]